jgi:hypothetical protein
MKSRRSKSGTRRCFSFLENDSAKILESCLIVVDGGRKYAVSVINVVLIAAAGETAFVCAFNCYGWTGTPLTCLGRCPTSATFTSELSELHGQAFRGYAGMSEVLSKKHLDLRLNYYQQGHLSDTREMADGSSLPNIRRVRRRAE